MEGFSPPGTHSKNSFSIIVMTHCIAPCAKVDCLTPCAKVDCLIPCTKVECLTPFLCGMPFISPYAFLSPYALSIALRLDLITGRVGWVLITNTQLIWVSDLPRFNRAVRECRLQSEVFSI